jgi:nicotinamide mononucleotide transporter
MNLLSVNTIMVTIMDYPLSYIEFFGTILYFLSAFLVSRKNIMTWPIGIVSVILYFILFYQIQLYADMIEQVYYLGVSVFGWVTWQKRKEREQEQVIKTSWSARREIILTLSITLVSAAILYFCISNFNVWFPSIFTEPSSYPILDALTTVMSFVAMYLMTVRRNESWIYWIIVDIIAVWLYWVKDVKFISIQYMLLLGNAIYGLSIWVKKSRGG